MDIIGTLSIRMKLFLLPNSVASRCFLTVEFLVREELAKDTLAPIEEYAT